MGRVGESGSETHAGPPQRCRTEVMGTPVASDGGRGGPDGARGDADGARDRHGGVSPPHRLLPDGLAAGVSARDHPRFLSCRHVLQPSS